MKQALTVIGEAVLMFLAGLVFMFWRPLHLTHILWQTETQRRTFEGDWIVGVLAVALLIALIELALKRLQRTWYIVAIAFALALVLGFVAHLGFKLTDLMAAVL